MWGDLTGTCGGNTLAECEELIWAEMLSVSTGVASGMDDDDDGVDDVMIAGMLLMNDCGAVLDMLDIPPGMATGFSCCLTCCCPICGDAVSMLAPSYALSPDLSALKPPAMTGARERGILCFKFVCCSSPCLLA